MGEARLIHRVPAGGLWALLVCRRVAFFTSTVSAFTPALGPCGLALFFLVFILGLFRLFFFLEVVNTLVCLFCLLSVLLLLVVLVFSGHLFCFPKAVLTPVCLFYRLGIFSLVAIAECYSNPGVTRGAWPYPTCLLFWRVSSSSCGCGGHLQITHKLCYIPYCFSLSLSLPPQYKEQNLYTDRLNRSRSAYLSQSLKSCVSVPP